MRGEETEMFITVGDNVSGTYWGIPLSRERRLPVEAVECQ